VLLPLSGTDQFVLAAADQINLQLNSNYNFLIMRNSLAGFIFLC